MSEARMKGRLLLDSLKVKIGEAVRQGVPEHRLGIAFSGGIDSTLLAKVCMDVGKDVTLITIGFSGSHDIEFSRQIASGLGLPQHIAEISASDFPIKLRYIKQKITCGNTSHLENCIAYYYVSQAAKQLGLSLILSANGCDELFCGYNGYRLAYDDGPDALGKLMDEKIANERLLVDEISAVAQEFGVAIRQPFLSPEFILFAKTIPLAFKITGPDDMMRKHILRQAAFELGVPIESAMKPKKALQYGTLIHRNFQRAKHATTMDQS